MESSQKKKLVLWVVVILVLIGAWKFARYHNTRPDPDLYQVVLLTNDQAFYGKLHNTHSRAPYLTDVYYLNPQAAERDKTGRQIGNNKFTVVKRGIDEIHQPTDRMYFSRQNLLYWENVGADSLVARGIKADKEFRAKQPKKTEERK